jgi:hypothetical protein
MHLKGANGKRDFYEWGRKLWSKAQRNGWD